MKKTIYFDRFRRVPWPSPSELEPFFLAPKGQEWSYQGGNDSWGMSIDELEGTEGLPEIDQVGVRLFMIGNPDLGVYFAYSRWDGRIRKKYNYNCKGDLSRLGEFVESLHETQLSVGLFVPFPAAWDAVKQFMESNGALPLNDAWIASEELPPETFPLPRMFGQL